MHRIVSEKSKQLFGTKIEGWKPEILILVIKKDHWKFIEKNNKIHFNLKSKYKKLQKIKIRLFIQ